jgi:hypothetical protein
VGKDELNNIEDFLTNDRFICYVFEQTSSLKKYWDDYFKCNPEKESLARNARQVLLNEDDKPGISSTEKEELKQRILSTVMKVNSYK